jgi:hypothetical protein
MREIVYFVFGTPAVGGVFLYEQGGILAGLEVYGWNDPAPTTLPAPESLQTD